MSKLLRPVPWDSPLFGIDCFEVSEYSEEALALTDKHDGHYTIKVDPLSDKSLLHRYGFYYTDTLITPTCEQQHLQLKIDPEMKAKQADQLQPLLALCDKTFEYGRFHRDFHLPDNKADARYKQWLSQLAEKGDVISLYYKGQLAAFIGHHKGELQLHAVAAEFRGKGLARSLWSAAIASLLEQGVTHFSSSISAANLAALNLYVSLGFRFTRACDTYHKLTSLK